MVGKLRLQNTHTGTRSNLSLVLDGASIRDVKTNPPWTHPVDEEGLDEFDNLQGDQETDGNQIVEQNNEGEEVEAKVSGASVCQERNFRQREAIQEETHERWFVTQSKLKAKSYSQSMIDITRSRKMVWVNVVHYLELTNSSTQPHHLPTQIMQLPNLISQELKSSKWGLRCLK